MRTALIALAAALALPGAARAEPEVVLYHQGRLLTTQDTPVNEAKQMTFRLYTRVDGTTSDVAWEETYDVRFTANGNYAVGLGDPANNKRRLDGAKLAGDRWLGVTVDGLELQPRLKLGAVASAIDALHLGGKPASEYALKTDDAPNALKLGGKAASEYALKTDVSTDAQKLGGRLPGEYQLKGEDAANALKLGGKLPGEYALKTEVSSDAATLQGRGAADFLAKDGVAADSAKLEGLGASAFLRAGSTSAQAGGLVLDGALGAASLRLAPRTSEPFECKAGADGSIYWNSQKKRFFACDGVSWTDFAGVGETPVSCAEILRRQPTAGPGVYTIDPDGGAGAISPVQVYCDMTTAGGGWTLVLRDRLNDGSVVRSTQLAWPANQEGQPGGSGDYLVAANVLAAVPRAQQQYQYLVIATGTSSIAGQYAFCRQDEAITKNGPPANGSCVFQDNSTNSNMSRGISFHDSGCKNVAFWNDAQSVGSWWQGSLFAETPSSTCGWPTKFPNALGSAPFGDGVLRTSDYTTWIYMR